MQAVKKEILFYGNKWTLFQLHEPHSCVQVMLGAQQQSPVQAQPQTATQQPATPQNVQQPRGTTPFMNQPSAPGYHPNLARPRWSMMPPQPQNPRPPYSNPQSQSSALIAQLTQPPNTMVNPQFPSKWHVSLAFVSQKFS